MRWIVLCFIIFGFSKLEADVPKKPRVLHITFHKGCAEEIEKVGEALSLDITTWFIHELPPGFLDGQTRGAALYNIGHARAQRIWDRHREFFDSFDAVLTSDTGPLSRIFLQNNWPKPLIIWMCNRFDYADRASLDCTFPDREYYTLFREACSKETVKIVAYTAYEHIYAKTKGIDTGDLLIKPAGFVSSSVLVSKIPEDLCKNETFFLPPYHNETVFMDLSAYCQFLGIQTYCGRYNGPKDLEGFKGVIHLPYSWSNLALFECLEMGMVYFIPSEKFLRSLYQKGKYFIPDMNDLFYKESEWFCEENSPYFVYFDSWEDLCHKIVATDYIEQRKKIQEFAKTRKKQTLDNWKNVFEDLGIFSP